MQDIEYTSFTDGEALRIPSTDTLCKMINTKFKNIQCANERLEQQVKKLQDEHYKDKELERMKSECDAMREKLNLSFPMTKEENESIANWWEEHKKKPHKMHRGNLTYSFFCTELGIIGKVSCSCGKTFLFRNID